MVGQADGDTLGEDGAALFAAGPVAVFAWRNEPGWPVEYVSSNVERLFGYSPAELYAENPPYVELVHDDDVGRVLHEVKRNSDETTKRFHHKPYRIRTKDGEIRWVLDYTRILRDDGEITGYTGYLVDITERKERLEYATALNATIRSLHRALIGAESRERVHENVCRSLAELGGFEGVWIGTIDPETDEVRPVAQSGVSEEYLEAVPLSIDSDASVPAVRVAADRETVGKHHIPDPDAPPDESWQTNALAAGYRSVFAVPICHEGLFYGILTVYGEDIDTFDGRIREILTELGTLVGYAVTAVERRNALHAAGNRDLVLGIDVDDDDPLRRLAHQLGITIEVRSVSRRKGDVPLLYCLLPGVSPEVAARIAEGVPGIRSIEYLSEAGAPLYEIATDDACVASKVTALGARLRSLRVSERDCELVVSVRRERDQRRFIRQAEELFGGAELTAERDAAPPEPMPWPNLLTDALTERQRDVLRAAYHAGYFDENRKRTGAEVAESLGIAQPTFSAHMRAAQRNLLSAIWDEG